MASESVSVSEFIFDDVTTKSLHVSLSARLETDEWCGGGAGGPTNVLPSPVLSNTQLNSTELHRASLSLIYCGSFSLSCESLTGPEENVQSFPWDCWPSQLDTLRARQELCKT